MIWFKPYAVSDLGQMRDWLPHQLGIEFIEVGADFLKGRMPVDQRTRQPHGILHGGASVALAETLASTAASMCIDRTKFRCVGQEINANHIRAAREGWVFGVAKPFHLGGRSHVWDIRITDEQDRLVCVSRMTAAIIDAQSVSRS